MIKACYERKLVIGDLPGKEVVPPTKEECIRIVPKTFYKTIFKMKSMIEDADIPHLNEDEHTWVEEKEKEIVMESKEKIEIQPEKEKENPDIVEKPSKKKKKKYPPVEDHDPSIPRFDEKYYNDLCRRTAAKNAALHSIRCDLQLKFWVAEKFKDDTFYFPYNLDFRGRAYPVPPNLNHLGESSCGYMLCIFIMCFLSSCIPCTSDRKQLSDVCCIVLAVQYCKQAAQQHKLLKSSHILLLSPSTPSIHPTPPPPLNTGSDLCRALLVFDEVKALGDSGLFWMKVHLSNLFGNNKVSHDDRVAFVESHMQKILESVESPLEGEMWWSTAEEPFQALATMIGKASQ